MWRTVPVFLRHARPDRGIQGRRHYGSQGFPDRRIEPGNDDSGAGIVAR